jgi:hypothetical protein
VEQSLSIIHAPHATTWGHGRATLAAVLERDHQIQPWDDEPIPKPSGTTRTLYDPTRVVLGSSVYLVSHHAAVRHRGDAVLLQDRGRIHVLTERGEIVLDPSEEHALRAWWSDL